MALPGPLVLAVSGQAKGTVAFVIGAGTSIEAPTSLGSSAAYSQAAYNLLVAANLINADDCKNPADLSCVADAMWNRSGSQVELVRRLPRLELANATSNLGHKIAAVLLREHIAGAVLTLNFDLAMAHAVAAMGAGAEVAIIRGPGQHADYGGVCVIHLHRDVNAEPDDWILRTTQLDNDWRDEWEELMATCVAARPVVVFAGLGSPAAVLTETVKRLRQATHATVIEVSPQTHGESPFAAALDVAPANHVSSGWCAFMEELGTVIVKIQVQEWRTAHEQVVLREHLSAENIENLFGQLGDLDLLGLGGVRAAWLMSQSDFEVAHGVPLEHLADLTHCIGALERVSGWTITVQPHDGSVEFRDAEKLMVTVFPISGQGTRRRSAVESHVRNSPRVRQRRRSEPIVVLLSASVGPVPVLPENLVGEDVVDSIVTATPKLTIVEVDDLRIDPTAFFGQI